MITMFQEALEKTRGEETSYKDSLLLWYDFVYNPAVHEIKKSGVLERFPGRTEADLFVWMWQYQYRLLKHYTSNPVHRAVEAASSFVKWPLLKVKRLLWGDRLPS